MLPDRTVSGHHARIHHAYGLAVLEDLGSTNGSSVNGKRVTRRALENGDIIVIGNCQLRFETDEKVRTDEPETQDSGPPTQILRVNTPGMPPAPWAGRPPSTSASCAPVSRPIRWNCPCACVS